MDPSSPGPSPTSGTSAATAAPQATGAPSIGELLVSSRSFEEYLAMFDLTAADVAGRHVLDCPGGAASFTVGAAEAGAAAVAVDPAYAGPHAALVELAVSDGHRGNAYIRDNPELFVWDFFTSPDDHLRSRLASVERFDADRRSVPERYLAGSLPQLPFSDASFDLAVSSHLLFTYDDRLDAAFHVAAVRELSRVATEVRLFPTWSMRQTVSELVPIVVAALEEDGASVEIRTAPYRLQRGDHDMVIVRR